MISTHVLNTEEGVPESGMKVGLFRGKELISLQETDENGRIAELAGDTLDPGEYRLVFYVDGPFFERIDLTVAVVEPGGHYHVPLLISAFACTSYRGS
jgi:5-hydroxyisourate hydrolase